MMTLLLSTRRNIVIFQWYTEVQSLDKKAGNRAQDGFPIRKWVPYALISVYQVGTWYQVYSNEPQILSVLSLPFVCLIS